VRGRALLLVATLALLWGTSYFFIKVAVETIPPLTVAALRAALSCAFLFLLLGRNVPSLWRSDIPLYAYFKQALFNCVIPWTLLSWASTSIDSSLATVLNSLSPIFMFLLTWGITRHEPAPPRKFVGVLLGLAGVVVIIGVDALSGLGTHLLAELACVVGALSYSIAGIVGRRFDRLSPLVPAAGATLVASAVLVPLALLVERPWTADPSMRSMAAMLALAVLSTGAAFAVYFKLLSTIGSIATTSQAYLRILVGVAFGVAFLGESLTPQLIAGVVLVVSGVIAMNLGKAPKPSA
jgi:drug/metabolite transporter (DMT)-like permease